VPGPQLAALWEKAEPMPGGRGTARFCIVDGVKAVVKKERRGGFSRHILPDLFLFRGPFLSEQALADNLKELGLSPAFLERQFLRTGPLFSVTTLVEYAENARSLADLWRDGLLDGGALKIAGGGVASLHKARVLHGDLNAGNVLIAPEGSALFLDLRHSRRPDKAPSAASRRKNLLRLARSLHKLHQTLGLEWPQEVWTDLALGYAEAWGEKEPWLERWALRCRRGFPVRSLFWKRLPRSS